ncbi:meiotic recombination protein REC8 homolog [Dasypus novemcinctus]|uniref:meiotic recombination protein REC8 homolog n=1 Tax=Dasypus novemcinctus TaxID=9361 RepID=UPI00265F935A|nr:meiotic recombination protein REC8 homolog [Dasypus novemcinctus]
MFYYPNVLQRHTGCFATIWLAATRGSRLVKREYLKVNVVKTCEEILNYVLVRVQPPLPGLPRPRFSLYLSAQLQIGVIRVYFQQCQYLVEDIQHILERLHRAQLQIRIDMVEPELPSLLLPDCLAMMETLEDAPDPFFGMMSVDPRLPSPLDVPQIRHLLEAATPERVLEETPPEVPTEPEKPERLLVTVVSPEAITLREAEPIRVLQIEGERDLPEISRRDLDLLIAEEDEAILLEERLQARLLRERRAPVALDGQSPGPGGLTGQTRMFLGCLGPHSFLPSQVLREAQEPSGPLMLSSELSLEAAEEEKSRISLVPPEERWAWAEAEQPELPALPVVPELPEVPMEMPLGLPLELELLSLEAVHRAVALELQADREPDFSSLVAPLSPRRMAARVFYLLLVLSAQKILRVEQEKPYGRLLIQPGPRFHSG